MSNKVMKDDTGQAINTTLQSLVGAISPAAANVTFDNTGTDLTSSNVQSVVVELNNIKQNNIVGGAVSGINFDDYKTQGNYWVNTTNSTNAPTTGFCFLEVVQVSASVRMQRATQYASSGTNMGITWVRWYVNALWGPWIDVALANTCSITRQSGVSSSTPIPTITRRGRIVVIHFSQQFPAGTYYELYNVSPSPTGSQHAIVDIGSNKNVIYISNDGKLRFNNSITLSSAQYVIGQLVYLTDD